jgi:hypothetical protein
MSTPNEQSILYNDAQQDDHHRLLILPGADTQQTQISALTQDSTLSDVTTRKRKSSEIGSTSTSISTSGVVKSKRVGLSTNISPLSKGQFISNDDKNVQFAQYINKANEDAIKQFRLVLAPSSSLTSETWKYFHLVQYYEELPKQIYSTHEPDREYACCNICGSTVVCKSLNKKSNKMRATGAGIKSHLESAHKIYKEENESTKSTNTSSITDCFGKQSGPKFVSNSHKQEHVDNKTVKWIAKECLPINTTESTSYQEMMKAAYNGYKNMGRKKVKQKLYQLSKKVRKLIRERVGKTNHVSITSDHWTSIAKQNYEGVTIHWIDEEWKLHSLPLGCFLHEGDSKSESLVQSFFERLFEGLGVEELNVIAIVTDTTSNMNKFGLIMKEGNKIDHIYCTDHVLQLSAKIAFTENGADIQPIVKLRRLVKYFNKSTQATDLLKKQQKHLIDIYKGAVPLILMLDVVTRWWSTFTMVERALKLKVAIQSMVVAGQIPAEHHISDADWKYIESVRAVMMPFRAAQKTLEGEKYVTASFVVGMIREMRKDLNKTSSEDQLANQLSKKILEDFENRWGDADYAIFELGLGVDAEIRRVQQNRQKGIHPVLVLATALDPRTKNLKGMKHQEINQVWDYVSNSLLRMYAGEDEDENGDDEDDNSEDDNSDNDEDQFLSQLPRKTINPNYVRQTSCASTGTVTINANSTQDDSFDFLKRVMGSDDDNDDNGGHGVGENIENLIAQEIKLYRREQKVPLVSGTTGKFTDVLEWWKYNERIYPMLASLARIVLCIPATSAPSERIFSTANLIISKKRARLDPETAGDIIFLHDTIDWYEEHNDE